MFDIWLSVLIAGGVLCGIVGWVLTFSDEHGDLHYYTEKYLLMPSLWVAAVMVVLVAGAFLWGLTKIFL